MRIHDEVVMMLRIPPFPESENILVPICPD
jgi:hypothetical protein